ncbi:unnamed protein product [Ceutorhynchus assimilis]|uniref:Spatacsin C-terminal domain-containing protein n=1 Tax=Ceutorhynchus assimilis TaxID=467358 RepID=A0A9N9MI69_9CUCU|nr:unnamed protein product [Ceutorhynchus assimilis]
MHNIKYHKYIAGSSPPITSNLSLQRKSSNDHLGEGSSENKDETVLRDKRSNTVKENLDPPPPRDISKENLGLWIGWTYKSDREVVREAASKGDVPLAINFLSLRKNVEAYKIKEFIDAEILLWVDELLNRKLIFRVFTILQNIDRDPITELQNMFRKTTSSDRREYIGNHLKTRDGLPKYLEQLWTFLDIIRENKVLTHHDNLLEDSIESLKAQDDGWKERVAAKLFLTTHDSRLIPLIKSEVFWNLLLATNEQHLLKAWIQIAFSSNTEISNVPENILVILKSFPITETMIQDLTRVQLPKENLEKILSELALYGIFIDEERSDFIKVLSRIDASDSLVNTYEILGKTHSNLPLIKFIPMLIDYCLDKDLLIVLNACTSNFDLTIIPKLKDNEHLNLMKDFRNLTMDFEEATLKENIFKVAQYLSTDDDLDKYFCDNPLIFLSLLIFNENISLEEAIHEKSLILNDKELFPCLSSIMKQLKVVSSLYFRKTKGVSCSLTYFDLIEKHLKINVKKAFAYYFEDKSLPSFTNFDLRQNYAYSKKLGFSFYLKQHRPSLAAKKFYIDLLKDYKDIDKNISKNKVYRMAIKNFQDISLTSGCIAFLEIIGINSEFLRISIKACNILYQTGMDVDNIVALALNIEENRLVVQTFLDENIIKFIDFTKILHGSEFIKAIRLYDIVIKFSLLYSLPLPESFLRHLAQNNLWLPFLIYAQIKNYPIDDIKKMCSHFKNPNILEHVVHSVLNDIQVDETNVLMKQRDVRKHWLSRIGVRGSMESSLVASGSLRSRSTLSGGSFDDGNISSSGSELLEIDITNTKATLLQTLIRCHNSCDPPRALLQACQLYRTPLLAILATSYEPDSVITNWLTWLAVSTDLNEVFTNFESMSASSQRVTDLLDNCMKNKFPKTLFQSFAIFIPENPLPSFCDFLNQAIQRDYAINFLTPKLEKFKSSKSTRRASVLSQTDYEMTYLKNKIWLEATALQLLCSAIIYNTSSLFDQLKFVELLCAVDLQSYFSCEVPKFENLLVIMRTLFDTGISLNLIDFFNGAKQQEAIQICINELVNISLFDEALIIAKDSNINTDLIVLRKWQNRFNRNKITEEFLTKCDQDFELQKVSPECVISFYKERASINDLERYCLLKFSHKWASKYDLNSRYELERKKILAYIKIPDKINITELDDINLNKNYTTYKEMLDILNTIEPPQVALVTDYSEKLGDILTRALDKGNFWLALKLERMFGCQSHDLDILKLCHELAEGLVLPHQLREEQYKIIERVKEMQSLSHTRRLYKSNSVSSDGNFLDILEEETEPSIRATQGLIHLLIEKLSHGSNLAYTVFMKYRISTNIEVPYDTVVSNTDPIKMLKDALQDDCINKLEVVHDFFEVFEWSKEEVTNFICNQFVTAASTYSKSKIDVFSMWDIKVGDQFHLVLKLIKGECSTLGYQFYGHANSLHEQQVAANDSNFKISEMSLVVELLIAAHSCFTADCNMEGISTILKKCRKVISHLLNVRSWKLIVRLLTGVGRYTELNFVFEILKENDQFEFLLSKGSKRDERLKLACIEYLKKYCPQDKKLYELVAIHFNMYSDVAMVWEREAQKFLKYLLDLAVAEMQNSGVHMESLEAEVLTKSDGTIMLLNKARDNYFNAAQFHTRGEKLSNAMNAAKQAEIVVLQLSLFRTVGNNERVPCLLNLSVSKIAKLMSNDLNFHQSNILAQAYNVSPDWAQILYEQAVTNNNMAYFEQFKETIGLNDELIQDIVRKFPARQMTSKKEFTVLEFKNIKYILEQLESIFVKYRLASELGFNSLVQDINENGEISYLRDTVWKSGYKGRSSLKSQDQ